ncbi:hypothetical protein [Luethyella okanaganae]|uniref:Uncharacterized protein n=1 Tax=Luethyella okanaganae TaxID=69372 RepID=A0ABW1VHQ6_9MICO
MDDHFASGSKLTDPKLWSVLDKAMTMYDLAEHVEEKAMAHPRPARVVGRRWKRRQEGGGA